MSALLDSLLYCQPLPAHLLANARTAEFVRADAGIEDEPYTADDAHEAAEAELMANGYVVSLAASEACRDPELVTPHETLNTDDYHAIGRPMHELMAVMASGTLKAADAALREWRDRLPALMARDISERAEELLAEAA